MSRKALKDFVHAVEHSAALRRELHAISATSDLLELAHRWGFSINQQDLDEDERCGALEDWFEASRIRR